MTFNSLVCFIERDYMKLGVIFIKGCIHRSTGHIITVRINSFTSEFSVIVIIIPVKHKCTFCISFQFFKKCCKVDIIFPENSECIGSSYSGTDIITCPESPFSKTNPGSGIVSVNCILQIRYLPDWLPKGNVLGNPAILNKCIIPQRTGSL